MTSSTQNCMKDITIVHVGERNFRVITASLPTEFSSQKEQKDIYVRQNNKENENSVEDDETTLKLDIPRDFYGHIIGKGGRNVKQLNLETGAKISFPSFPLTGLVTIVGTKKGAEMAKKRIMEIVEKSKDEDSIEYEIKFSVPSYSHGVIKGKGGYTINQIKYETKTYIKIWNTVVISGTKDDVKIAEKRIDEIIKSHNNSRNNGESNANNTDILEYEIKFSVPSHLHGAIFGRGRYTVNKIKSETKTNIIVGDLVVIRGTKDDVKTAETRIDEIIKSVNNSHNNGESNANNTDVNSIGDSVKDSTEYEVRFSIPPHSRGPIIGKGGHTVNQIKSETRTNITVGDLVVIGGTKGGVEMAKKRIDEIIKSVSNSYNNRESYTNNIDSVECEVKFSVPSHLHGVIIGIGGGTINRIRSETQTYINIGDPVVISGTKNGVEMARKQIDETIKSHNNRESNVNSTNDANSVGESVKEIKFSVPLHLHRKIIGKGGYIVNQIKSETKTNIIVGDRFDGDCVVIRGAKDDVEMAKKRIDEIIKSIESTSNSKENVESIRESVKESIKYNKEAHITYEFNVPQDLHGKIIGKGGYNVNKIKSETKTYISVGDRFGGDCVVIKGTKDGVEMAKKKIDEIIRPLIRPTHFISLPLVIDTRLQNIVKSFDSEVLKLNTRGMDNSILINPSSLHITMGTLKLNRKEDIDGAVKLLKSLSTEIHNIIGPRTLVPTLTSLGVMNDNPENAHVLYIKVVEQDGQNILEKLAEYLAEKFAEAGYLTKEDRPLKLHVTLINTRHRVNENENYGSGEFPQRIPFDAAPILNDSNLSTCNFGVIRIESVHISKIGEHDEDGRHRSEGCIKLP